MFRIKLPFLRFKPFSPNQTNTWDGSPFSFLVWAVPLIKNARHQISFGAPGTKLGDLHEVLWGTMRQPGTKLKEKIQTRAQQRGASSILVAGLPHLCSKASQLCSSVS